ncbi:hypothetical protein VPHK491_0230 [Vibrio phage K491]
MCRCDTCLAEMPTASAIDDHGHHDGWEMPPYTMYMCPLCTDGYMEDFWPSHESYMNWRTETELSPEEFKRLYYGDWQCET